MTLRIGMTMPDRALEESRIDQAITRLAERVALEKRDRRLPAGSALDITFLLASENQAPPFSGMRMGGYTPDNAILYFQAAVPARLARSEDAPRYVALVLQDVVDNASEFFLAHGVDFDASAWRRFLADLDTGRLPA